MSGLSKYWKALLAAVLAAVAFFLYSNVYTTEKLAYESEKQTLRVMIQAAQTAIAENRPYADVQEQINAEMENLTASRLDLYEHFPIMVKEEDQIMYVLYLESVFGTEISFEFSEAMPVSTESLPNGRLYDGSILKTVDLIVNYRSSYEGFQQMIDYLAQDSRIVSVDKANIKYYPKQDLAIGYVKVQMYVLDTTDSNDEEIRELREYVKPDIVNKPNTGKDNIFDNKYDQPSKEVPQQKPAPTRDDLKPGGGSDLDSKVWVTTADGGRYHSKYGCAYSTQVYYDEQQPSQMTLLEIEMYDIQPCELCFG